MCVHEPITPKGENPPIEGVCKYCGVEIEATCGKPRIYRVLETRATRQLTEHKINGIEVTSEEFDQAMETGIFPAK